MTDSPVGDAQSSEGRGHSLITLPSGSPPGTIPSPAANPSDSSEPSQPAPAGASVSASIDLKSRFAEDAHQYIREYIRAADQKAVFLFTGATALLAFLYKNGVSRNWLKPIMTWNVLDMVAFTSMIALSVGVVFALWVVWPRLDGSRRGYLFWDAIAEHASGREYADALAALSPASLLQIKAEHCYELARISRSKYRALHFALWASAIGLVASLFVFLFGISSPIH